VARRGYFRRPRTGGSNLTALIAQLLREQKAAEDRAIFDAYNNGGEYKGKPVTDSMILGYIKTRRDGFSVDDPLWDEWDNRLTQTEFGIGESKIGLAFKRGNASPGKVADFYRGWLKKLPRDSAFWREVAGKAADWAKAGRAAARGSARASLAGAVNRRLKDSYQTQADWNAVNDILTDAARRAGLIDANDDLADADASQVMELINAGIVIMTDGEPMTFRDWRQLDMDMFHALRKEIRVKNRAGTSTLTLQSNLKRFVKDTVLRNNAVDDRAKAEAARDVFEMAVEAARGDPYAIEKARQEYVGALGDILAAAEAADPTFAGEQGLSVNDPEFIGQLRNEYQTFESGKVPEGTGRGITGDKLDDDAEQLTEDRGRFEALEGGDAYWGQDKPGGAFTVIPKVTNPNDLAGNINGDPSLRPAVVQINGSFQTVVLAGTPVYATTVIDEEGKPVDLVTQVTDPDTGEIDEALWQQFITDLNAGRYTVEQNPQVLGFEFAEPDGEKSWGVYDAAGNLVYTSEDPFGNRLNGQIIATAEVDDEGRVTGIDESTVIDPAIYSGGEGSPLLVTPAADPRTLLRLNDQYDPETGLNTFGLTSQEALQFGAYVIDRVGHPLPSVFGERQIARPRPTDPYGERNLDVLQGYTTPRRGEPQRGPSATYGERNLDRTPGVSLAPPPKPRTSIKPPPTIKLPTVTAPRPPKPGAPGVSGANRPRIYEPPPPPKPRVKKRRKTTVTSGAPTTQTYL